jgi:hypothetical protein
MSELNRRNALVAVASLTTVGIPATALAASSPATPDPIFAAIEARKRAEARSYYEVGSRLDVDEETERDCADADVDALRAMFLTVPTTAAGAVALLRYVRECEADVDDILQIYMDEAGERQGGNALFDSLVAALTPLAVVQS